MVFEFVYNKIYSYMHKAVSNSSNVIFTENSRYEVGPNTW